MQCSLGRILLKFCSNVEVTIQAIENIFCVYVWENKKNTTVGDSCFTFTQNFTTLMEKEQEVF